MKATILALVTAGALLAATSTADAKPPRFRNNFNGVRFYPSINTSPYYYRNFYPGYNYYNPGFSLNTGNFSLFIGNRGVYPYWGYGTGYYGQPYYGGYYGRPYYYGGRWWNW